MADFADDLQSCIEDGDVGAIYVQLKRVCDIPDGLGLLKGVCASLVDLACRDGHTGILELLWQFDLGINTTMNNKKSCVQLACECNQTTVLDFLYTKGVEIFTPGIEPWHDNSPLYIGCKFGHKDIVEFLIDKFPEKVKKEDVRSCLLYAACLGGNSKVVTKFLSPTTDVNHFVQLVRKFSNCEQMTPLYAACSGGHVNVVSDLFNNSPSLELTETVCRDFPDIIGQFLTEYFKPMDDTDTEPEPDDLFQLFSGYLQRKNLYYLHGSWLLPYSVTLCELDISHNSIAQLPDCLPWQFQNLRHFNASHNLLKAITYKCDQASQNDPECCSLEDVDLSHNNLESVCIEFYNITSLVTLNLSHNKLSYLSRSIHQDAEFVHSPQKRQSTYEKKWTCSKLKTLNVSHNSLVMLPADLKHCTGLSHLYANNNQLIAFPKPWQCPLETLNLADNQLERFPTNIETFWCHSLLYINVGSNKLDAIDEGIVKLGKLCELNASRNRIERLPAPEIWDCRNLHRLNLKHNRLGLLPATSPRGNVSFIPSFARRTSNSEDKEIALPMCLMRCLKHLKLADNNLDVVPRTVCQLLSLETLDLSDNPLIKTLPRELGKLQNLLTLKMKNVTPKLSDSIGRNFTANGSKTQDMLSDFLADLRESKPWCKVKVVVLGKKDKGKTTLVNLLANKSLQLGQQQKSIMRQEVTLSAKKDFPLSMKKSADVHLNVWDVSGDEVYSLIHHCVFTHHTLYMIVWDFWAIVDEVERIRTLVNNIQASTSSANIVLVGTFLDKMLMTGEEKRRAVELVEVTMHTRFQQYGDNTPVLCPVSCINNDGIDHLKTTLYQTCMNMARYDRVKRARQSLVGRKVPKSYITVQAMLEKTQERLTKEEKPLCLTQGEFVAILEAVKCKNFDLTSSEEIANVTKFLVESGYLVHFADHLGALDSIYFLDPAWLFDILVHVLISAEGKRLLEVGQGEICRHDVQRIYRESLRFPSRFIEQYLELLERFEIAASISQSKKLFFTSQLEKAQPHIDSKEAIDPSKVIRRLFCMKECPSGFWTRLLTRMKMRIEQFSHADWTFKPAQTQSIRMGGTFRHGSRNKDGQKSINYTGLHLKNPTITFLREWMRVSHADGSFCVEPIKLTGIESMSSFQSGVLITEINRNEDFGIIGIIVDEIEDIIQDFYPGLLDIDSHTLKERIERYALCPTCYNSLPLPSTLNHFRVEQCAMRLIDGTPIICPQGVKHDLNSLVPDLLMKELPKKFFMEPSKLRVVESKENMLGGGVAGAVYKGTYDGQAIAAKIYRSDIRYKQQGSGGGSVSMSSDSGTASMSTQGSAGAGDDDIYANVKVKEVTHETTDREESECLKSFRALREFRQEVALTSRFRHPCIVSLIGLSFSPKLMIALELVPLGSLRSVLDKALADNPRSSYQCKGNLQTPLFEKDLTFKFVYQIAKGLDYLHNNGIVYKDLKSDNILTMSVDLDARVNLKLSDYGISKYSWGGRSVGLVGTMGYQAPEILEGVAYDEKVDIFSFSMVIYEILTGRRPYAEYTNLSQITKALKTEGKRPKLKDFNVHTKFPCIEELMIQCWQHQSSARPSANMIASRHCMRNLQFLSQCCTFTLDKSALFDSQCVLGVSEREDKSMLWVWEGEDETRTLTVLDPDWSSVVVQRRSYPGYRAMCITKVDDHIWLGNMNSEIEVFSSNYAALQMIGKDVLIGLPVQMVTVKHTTDEYSVCVALEQGVILEYKRQPAQQPVLASQHNRHSTVNSLQEYSRPSSVKLRSNTTHCIGLCETQRELWASNGNWIDIIDCSAFKVKSDQRINLQVLLQMCNVSEGLHVGQVACSDSQVFCMLTNSAYVLEFSASNHTCTGLINLDKQLLYGKVVITAIDFDDSEEGAYRNTKSGDQDDEKPDIPMRSCAVTGGDPPPVPRRLTNRSATLEPLTTNAATDKLDIPPEVPERINVKDRTKLYEQTSKQEKGTSQEQINLPSKGSVQERTKLFEQNQTAESFCQRSRSPRGRSKSPLPERSNSQERSNSPIEEKPPIPQRSSSLLRDLPPVESPPIPERSGSPESSCSPEKSGSPEGRSADEKPPIPERLSKLLLQDNKSITGASSNGTGASTTLPQIPEVPERLRLRPRASTMDPPKKTPLSDSSPEANDPSAAPSRPPKGSTLPATYSRVYKRLPEDPNSIAVSSLAVVGGQLWLGRTCGDICVVNTVKGTNTTMAYSNESSSDCRFTVKGTNTSPSSSPNASSSDCSSTGQVCDSYGKVVADMYDINNKHRGSKTPERVQLLATENYVMCAYTLVDYQDTGVEIAAWDRKPVENADKVENYWNQILKMEKSVAQE